MNELSNELSLNEIREIRDIWKKFLENSKQDNDGFKHWHDADEEQGIYKDIDALNALLESFLASKTDFHTPPLEASELFEYAGKIFSALNNPRDSKEGYEIFDSEPYPWTKGLKSGYTDAASNVLLLAINILETSAFMSGSDKNWKIEESLLKDIKKVSSLAISFLKESAIQDDKGVRWGVIKLKPDQIQYANIVSTWYAFFSLKRVFKSDESIKNSLGLSQRDLSDVRELLRNVPSWVYSLYDPRSEAFWISEARVGMPPSGSMYALDIIYSILDDDEISPQVNSPQQVKANCRKVLKQLLEKVLDNPQTLQTDWRIEYPYPGIKTVVLYDERRYIAGLLDTIANVIDRDTGFQEEYRNLVKNASSTLWEWVKSRMDKETGMWEANRTVVSYTRDVLIGYIRYLKSIKKSGLTIQIIDLRRALREYLASDDVINGAIKYIQENLPKTELIEKDGKL